MGLAEQRVVFVAVADFQAAFVEVVFAVVAVVL